VTTFRQMAEYTLCRSVLYLYSVHVTMLCQTQVSAAKCQGGCSCTVPVFGWKEREKLRNSSAGFLVEIRIRDFLNTK